MDWMREKEFFGQDNRDYVTKTRMQERVWGNMVGPVLDI